MLAYQLWECSAQFVCYLEYERTGETIFQIRRDEPTYMAEVVPNRTFKHEPLQSGEGIRR